MSLLPIKENSLKLFERYRYIILSWTLIRIITCILSATISHFRPFTDLELSMSIWPPQFLSVDWYKRTFLEPWLYCDGFIYQKILVQGYGFNDGRTSFHPLYPVLAKSLFILGLNPMISLLIVGSIMGFIVTIVFERLASLDLDIKTSRVSALLFLFFPFSFFLFAPYSEGLFLFLSISTIIYARKKQWFLSGIFGFLASLTRQQGILLLIPQAWELWEANNFNIKSALKRWQDWLFICTTSLGIISWSVVRIFLMNEKPPDFSSFNKFIFSTFISHSALIEYPYQEFIWPWQTVINALIKTWNAPDPDIYFNLVFGIIYILLLIIAWKHLRLSYRLYSIAVYLVSFSYYTGPFHPYMGLLRHLYISFPLFIGIAPYINTKKKIFYSFASSLDAMIITQIFFGGHSWIP